MMSFSIALGSGTLYIGFGTNLASGGIDASSDDVLDNTVSSSKIYFPSIVGVVNLIEIELI